MICPRCGNRNPDAARFCTRCGLALAPLRESPAKKFFLALLKAGAFITLYYVMQLAVCLVYMFALIVSYADPTLFSMSPEEIQLWMNDLANGPYMENIPAMLILSAVLTILVFVVFYLIRRKKPMAEMHLRPIPVKTAVLCLLFGVAAQVTVSLTIAMIPIPQTLIESFSETSIQLQNAPFLIEFVSVAIAAPVLEEILFRGLVFTRLRRGMRTGFALLLSAALFGLVHGHIISFCYAGILGLFLAAIMFRNEDSILGPILVHAAYNATTYLMAMITEFSLWVFALYFAALAAAIALAYVLIRKREPAGSPE